MFPRNSGYEYSNSRLFLVRKNGEELSDGVTYIKGNKALSARDTYIRCDHLSKGHYMLCTEVDWIQETEEKNYVITSYGAGKIDMYEELSDEGAHMVDRIELL